MAQKAKKLVEKNKETEAAKESAKNIFAANWASLIKPTEFLQEAVGKNVSVFKVEPLERGFGVTLGNALRRILLSSLQGAAIVSIKIEGVDHEYSSIPGVREDVTDLILNIKQIAVKYGGKDKKRMVLKATGPCVVTAGMIETPHEVEIVNKGLVLCTLDKNAKINIEFSIFTGKGYVSASDNRSTEMPLGSIPIDSIYSPVRRVVFKIENSRVGSETEYDKLYLTVETNGALTPELAVGFAAKILQDQLQTFISFNDIEEDMKQEEEKLPFDLNLLRKVDDLELSVRSQNCLKNDNITYIGDLVIKTEAEMLKTPNFGRKSLNEIRELLSSMNLKFGMDIPGWPPENVEELVKKYEDQLG